MKPGDHPDFFRLPPPAGASRESTIVIDGEGRFLHDGQPITHPGMARAFASWIDRHPDDGRFILNNGYDWTYVRVEDAPFAVVLLHGIDAGGSAGVELELSDGSREPLEPERITVGADGSLVSTVKGGRFRARFRRTAQLGLAPFLAEDENGRTLLLIGGRAHPLSVAAGGSGDEA